MANVLKEWSHDPESVQNLKRFIYVVRNSLILNVDDVPLRSNATLNSTMLGAHYKSLRETCSSTMVLFSRRLWERMSFMLIDSIKILIIRI